MQNPNDLKWKVGYRAKFSCKLWRFAGHISKHFSISLGDACARKIRLYGLFETIARIQQKEHAIYLDVYDDWNLLEQYVVAQGYAIGERSISRTENGLKSGAIVCPQINIDLQVQAPSCGQKVISRISQVMEFVSSRQLSRNFGFQDKPSPRAVLLSRSHRDPSGDNDIGNSDAPEMQPTDEQCRYRLGQRALT